MLDDYKKDEPAIEAEFQKIERENRNQTSQHPDQLKFWSMPDIMAFDFGEENWLVDLILPLPSIAVLSGNPGDFKSWLSLHFALCIARGLPVFNKFPARQGGVLIIDEENHLRHIKKRLAALGITPTDPIYYLSQSNFKLENKPMTEQVMAMVQDKQIKLLVLDSFVRVHSHDENDATQISQVFDCLQQFIKADISLFLIHHHRKQTGYKSSGRGQDLRGSSDIQAKVDSHLTVEYKKEDGLLVIDQPKLRQDEAQKAFEVKILKSEQGVPCGFEYLGDFNEKQKKAEEVADALGLVLQEGMKSRPELHTLLTDFGKTAIDEGIKIAIQRGIIEKVPVAELMELSANERRKSYYRTIADP